MEKSDFAKRLADKLIEQLKAGTAPWQQPWEAGQILSPYNPTTGNRYRGINILALMTREYADPRWMTYRQAQAQGWQVRGGEKATQIQHWIWEETRPRLGKDGQPELDSEGRPIRDVVRLSRPKVIAAAVFNAEQIDGIPELEPKTQKQQWDPIEQAEKLLRASNARIEHSAVGGAYYRVSSDTIHLPARERFENAGGYYSTALHELGHWTGHVDRLNRDLSNPFGSEAYAREELRAEIASLILGSELGLGYDPQHHAGYVDHWIKILTDTPQEILYAAADAERISEYILTIEQRQEKKQAQAREYLNDRQGLREIRKGYWEVTELEIEPEQLARDAEAVAALGGSFIIANGEYVDVQRCINFKKEFEQDSMQGALFRAGRNLASYLSALLPAEESGLSLIRSVTKAFQGADEESKNQFLDGFRRLLGFTAASHPDYDVWLNPDAGEGTDDVSLGPEEEEVREKASFRTLRRSEWCQVLAKELAKLPVQERKTNMKEHVPQSDRTYLAVPYDERAEAKAVGARWDATKKAWYVGPEVDPTKIARWELRHQPEPTLDPRAEFAEVLRSLGAVVEGDHPIMNGERQRIRTENDKRGEQTIFYIGHIDGVPNGYAENNRTKEVRRWKARGQHLSEEQRNELLAEAEKKRFERSQAEQTRFEATAIRLGTELRSLPSGVEKTGYHEAKGIEPLAGAPVRNGDLLVPGYDVDGKLWTVQYIKEDGTKRFAKDSRKHGCFHVVGASSRAEALEKLGKSPVIAITEGYATAATVAKYGNVPAIAAFDSGNLLAVATALHERWPDKRVMIAGDDDHRLENNPGRMKALEAAAAVDGVAIFPELSAEQREQGMTDFNDLGRAQPEVASRQLVATVNATREGRTIRKAEKFRAADSTRPKEWLEIEKVRPIGFIGKDILALEKKIPDPREIIKQNQGFEISRLLNQQREQEQHPGIDR